MTTTDEYSPPNDKPVNSPLHEEGTANGIINEQRGFEITPGQVKVPKTHNVSLWHLIGQHITQSKMATDTKYRNFGQSYYILN